MRKSTLLSKDHFYLSAAHHIKEVSKSLKHLNINLFTYCKKFHNGEEVYLSTNADWIDCYYNQSLYSTSLFINDFIHQESGCIVWPQESELPIFSYAKECFKCELGFTLVEKSLDYTEFYFFSTSSKQWSIVNQYLNNLDVFKHFILFFKNQAKKLLDRAEVHKILLPSTKIESKINFSFSQEYKIQKHMFMQETKIASYSLNIDSVHNINLTARELDCALSLLQGLNARETAEKFSISHRTVEIHLEHLKDKLNCMTKSELKKLLLQSELKKYVD